MASEFYRNEYAKYVTIGPNSVTTCTRCGGLIAFLYSKTKKKKYPVSVSNMTPINDQDDIRVNKTDFHTCPAID